MLPFLNLSSDPADEYLSDGITEETINSLANVEGLRVISQTSSFSFKGKRPVVPEVGARLKVEHVIEGSVRKAGDRLRITAQLIRVADDNHIWSQTYERDMKDVFAVQEEIARNIVNTLRLKLAASGRPLVKRYTENVEAYQLYLKGRYFWDKWHPDEVWKALGYFEQATARDPNYAPAYAGVAFCYQRLLSARGSGGRLSAAEGYPRMKAAAEKALEIDPLLAEGHAVLGTYYERQNDWPESERRFRRALEIDPGNVLARRWYGASFLAGVGRTEDAIREVRRSLELDPLSPDGDAVLAEVLLQAGRYDEAAEWCRKALELDPGFPRAQWTLGRVYVQKGMYAEGIQALLSAEKRMGREEYSPWLGYAYAVAGQKAEALRILDQALEASRRRRISPLAPALIYAGLGEKDRALELLERGDEGSRGFDPHAPELASLRSDPRFAALLKKLRLP